MEAARVAALRGHEVHLHEACDRLGGTVFFSSIVYPENGRLIDYLAREIRELGVHVRLNTTRDAESARALAPDVIVVATGARVVVTDLPGADLPHVFSGDEMREMVTGQSRPDARRKLRLTTSLMLRAGKSLALIAAARPSAA